MYEGRRKRKLIISAVEIFMLFQKSVNGYKNENIRSQILLRRKFVRGKVTLKEKDHFKATNRGFSINTIHSRYKNKKVILARRAAM